MFIFFSENLMGEDDHPVYSYHEPAFLLLSLMKCNISYSEVNPPGNVHLGTF